MRTIARSSLLGRFSGDIRGGYYIILRSYSEKGVGGFDDVGKSVKEEGRENAKRIRPAERFAVANPSVNLLKTDWPGCSQKNPDQVTNKTSFLGRN